MKRSGVRLRAGSGGRSGGGVGWVGEVGAARCPSAHGARARGTWQLAPPAPRATLCQAPQRARVGGKLEQRLCSRGTQRSWKSACWLWCPSLA